MRAHRILCPVDFSDPSRRALHYAAALASREGAVLYVLHVAPEAMPLPVPILMVALRRRGRRRAAAVQALEAFVARAGLPRPPGRDRAGGRARGRHSGLRGRASPPTSSCSARTAGRGIGHLLLGSTAERVLHKAMCPTPVVPLRAEEPGSVDGVRFTQVLCAVDLAGVDACPRPGAVDGPGSRRRADGAPRRRGGGGGRARKRAARGRAGARRWADPDRARTAAGRRARDAHARCTIREVVRYGRAAHAIPLEAGERAADLIVLGAHGHRGLALLGIGSTTHAVVCRATCPVLATRP